MRILTSCRIRSRAITGFCLDRRRRRFWPMYRGRPREKGSFRATPLTAGAGSLPKITASGARAGRLALPSVRLHGQTRSPSPAISKSIRERRESESDHAVRRLSQTGPQTAFGVNGRFGRSGISMIPVTRCRWERRCPRKREQHDSAALCRGQQRGRDARRPLISELS